MIQTRTVPTKLGRAAEAAERKVKNIGHRFEEHVRENPLKVVGQAAAIGYAFRFLPLRPLLAVGARLAPPLLCLAGLWKAAEFLEQKPGKPSDSRE
jgi:hypothetical protein